MYEIERKIRIDDDTTRAIQTYALKEGASFTSPTKEKDEYFRQKGFRQRIQNRDDYLARVRIRTDKCTLNLKKLSETPGVILEHETVTSDPEETIQIIILLGAEHACTITKTRRKCKIGNVEILLDEIAELGAYVEISIEVCDEKDTTQAAAQIEQLLAQIGLQNKAVELRGYPDILLEQQGVVFDRSAVSI